MLLMVVAGCCWLLSAASAVVLLLPHLLLAPGCHLTVLQHCNISNSMVLRTAHVGCA